MNATGFAIVNQSALVSEAAAKAMVAAVEEQWFDIAAAWNLGPMTFRLAGEAEIQLSEIPAILTDQVPQLGDLGFHNDIGGAAIQIEVVNILEGGPHDDATILRLVCPVLSHEIAEAGVDPLVNLWEPMPSGMQVALEVCDPVQDLHYAIGAAMVSNFVLPKWFDPDATVPGGFDQMGEVSKPFQILQGYAVEQDAEGHSTELFGDKAPLEARRLRSRRRMVRLCSTPSTPQT